MTQSFFIPGPLPGMNDFAGKKSRWHYGQLKREWGEMIGVYIHLAKLQPMARVKVHCCWIERNMKRDPDNIMSGVKFALDALVEKKILLNDGWEQIESITHAYTVDKARPGVLVTLEEVTP